MEIIHVVCGNANPSRMNGVNRVVNDLATHQANSGHRVRLWGITKFTRHDYPDRVYMTQLFRAHRNAFRLDQQLLLALDQIKPGTMFHLHGAWIPAFYSLGMALRQRKIPFVLTAHGGYNSIAMKKSRFRKKFYFRFFERKVLDAAQAIHCLGASEVGGLERIYPNKKTVIIPYGFQSPDQCNLSPLPGYFTIGFCGRIDIYAKGLDILLNAFALFAKRVPWARLWMVGDSKERFLLEALAQRLGIADKTIFFGSRFGDEKLGLLGKMQVFVHPSRNEGLPSAVLEAASMGVPCVVTEATNLGSVIDQYKCGVVIPDPDQAELYRALLRIHQRVLLEGRASLSANARLMIRESFDWNTIVEHFDQQLYHRA